MSGIYVDTLRVEIDEGVELKGSDTQPSAAHPFRAVLGQSFQGKLGVGA